MATVMSPPSSRVVQSKLKTTNWGQTFPVDLQTREASLKLVKKLLAVGVSTVLYLRSNIPESAYNNCQVDDLNLRILNAASESRPAKKITSWIRNAVEAIEKGFLAKLTLGMYRDSKRPEDAYETYVFEFEYMGSDKAPRMAFNSKAGMLEEGNVIFSDTRHMFRQIILLTQNLPPLPLGMYMTILLTYNDQAPLDYNPPGYKTGDLEFEVEKRNQPSIMGTVTTRHHRFKTLVHSGGLVEQSSPISSQKTMVTEQKRRSVTPKPTKGSLPPSPSSQAEFQDAAQLTSSGSDPGAKSIISNSQPSQHLRHRVQASGDIVATKRNRWEPKSMGLDEPQTPVKKPKRPRMANCMASEVKDDHPEEAY